MGLTDAASNLPEPLNVPKQYQQHAVWDVSGGTGATGPVREVVTDHKQLLRLAGLDPEAWRIVGKISGP